MHNMICAKDKITWYIKGINFVRGCTGQWAPSCEKPFLLNNSVVGWLVATGERDYVNSSEFFQFIFPQDGRLPVHRISRDAANSVMALSD